MKQKFEFMVDNKMEIWRRDYVTIEAESLEEAISLAESGEYDDFDSEYLYDTEVYMNPAGNGGQATCEVMDTDGNILWDNGSKQF